MQTRKPNFDDICDSLNVNVHVLHELSRTAGVGEVVLNNMLLNEPVRREDAEAVLRALSQHAGQTFTLDTVDVMLVGKEEADAATTKQE